MPTTTVNYKMAVANVNAGSDMKREMAITIGPNANWEEFITVSPMCIAILGDLICISTASDFALNKKPPKGGFKFLRHEHSFRASLVQVANSGYNAFDTAHKSMDQIRLKTLHVPENLKQAVQILLNASDQELEMMLNIPMTAIKKIADECLKLATDTEEKYNLVMNEISELLEACVSARGQYEHELNETKIAIAVAQKNITTAEEQKEMAQRQYANLEKAMKRAEDTYYKAMDAMPSGMELLTMNVAESVTKSFTGMLDRVTSMCTMRFVDVIDRKYFTTSDLPTQSQSQTTTTTDEGSMFVYSKAEFMLCQIKTLVSECISDDSLTKLTNNHLISIGVIEALFSQCREEIQATSASDNTVKERAIKLCSTGTQICKRIKDGTTSIQDLSDEGKDLATEIISLRDSIMTFTTEATALMGSSATGIKPPCQRVASKQVEGSAITSTAQQVIQNARFIATEASENLEYQRDRFEKAGDKMMESSRKLGKILADMQALDISKINFEEIKKTLLKGIKALAELKEQWAKIVSFFQMMSNLVECSLNQSLKKFLEYVNAGKSLKEGSKVYSMTKLMRDMIYTEAFQSAKIAYVINMISDTYVEVSEKYLLSRIAGLAKVLGYDPEEQKNEIIDERAKLFEDMTAAQKGITALIQNRKEEVSNEIDERINKIKDQLEAVLPPDDAFSVKDKERMLRATQKGIENAKDSNALVQSTNTVYVDVDDLC